MENLNKEFSAYIAYVTRNDRVIMMGPVRETREEIEIVCAEYCYQGWDNKERGLKVHWVEIGSHGPWLIAPPKHWWQR